MRYHLEEVNSRQAVKEFNALPVRLYQGHPNWIRPLDRDIEKVFNPKTNNLLRKGEAIRWLLRNEADLVVGRVAAFYDPITSRSQPQPTGGMGFFECINDPEAANILLDACSNWLKERGMEAIDGPINFGDRDRWWGLLVEGNSPPNYCMGYHHPYYQKLLESFGYKLHFRQFTYYRPVSAENVNPIVWEKAERISKNPSYTIEKISKRNLDKYANDFSTIYNKAWGRFSGVKPISKLHALALLKSIKPIMDERIIHFAYYNSEPIGFLVMIPDLNQVVRHLNGRFGLFDKLKFLYLLRVRRVCTKAIGLIYGTVPEHHGKGLEGALIKGLAKYALKDGFQYTDIEMNWIGDFNPGMCKVVEQIGAHVIKTHHTYRYMLDPSKEVIPPKRVS